MLTIFLNSLLIAYTGALMPGSLLTYTIDKGMKKGPSSGLLIILGHSLLELLIVVLILSGLGPYLGLLYVKAAIGFAGGAVLIYLGIGMIREAVSGKLN
jgi:threonine/homoserine/homoserine lactone efflux protein